MRTRTRLCAPKEHDGEETRRCKTISQPRKVAEENYADIVVGDFNTSAYRECGKAKMSSIEEAWE